MQISATIRLCFVGLSTFFVEFSIVFCAFSAFFFFVLKNDLENFRDFIRTLENTLAMSIGKFNFGALRAADEMAAWIFFVFSSKFFSSIYWFFFAVLKLLRLYKLPIWHFDFGMRFRWSTCVLVCLIWLILGMPQVTQDPVQIWRHQHFILKAFNYY